MELPTSVLLPGERLLWSGRPQRLTLARFDLYQFALGLFWGIVTIVVPVARHPLSHFAWAVGVGGLVSVWVPVVARSRARRRVEYVVTDRRIVLADRFSGRTRASAYLGTLPPPVARIRQDGSGTIDFGRFSDVSAVLTPSSVPLMLTGLVAVPEAGRVRDLIAWAQAGRA